MIHLECDNDEALILALGKTRAEVSHHAGKGRVSKALSESKRAYDFGLIDQDPGQPPPPYLREYKCVERDLKLGLVLYQHPKQGKRLIEIQPDLEPWIYKLGEAVGIKPSDHNLPAKHSGLHQEAKKHRKHLLSYLAACRSAGSPHLAKLVEWLALV
ncbi:hypothetical protein SAMN02745166_04974 [Prosthecobacter debontii]|uniref:Uncharacterized protein n=1 Tax=Prosthecobacter debontii TaxID=48467 RepID=A0A1T4Z4U9_9BACT|nr:hypothetical protein [Prosthecobacter debontii]SKB08591.1 hypothetical protein SAMN02745166_04974 [Prosthecobacter debontii]